MPDTACIASMLCEAHRRSAHGCRGSFAVGLMSRSSRGGNLYRPRTATFKIQPRYAGPGASQERAHLR